MTEKKLHIAMLANAESIHSRRWASFFADLGHRVDLVSGGEAPTEVPTNVRLVQLPKHSGRMPTIAAVRQFIALRDYLRLAKPDILHSHYAGVNGLMGALSGHRPFVLTAWGSDVLVAGKAFGIRQIVRYSLNKADVITCDAEHMKKAMTDMGVSVDRINIVFFGTDTATFAPGQRDKVLADRIGLNLDRPIVVSLRSFEPIYDLPTLVRAAGEVLRSHPATQFVMAGKGTLQRSVVELASSLGVGESFFFPGAMPAAELPHLLRLADVYVSTSLSDAGLAASTSEAMATGLAVVVTDSGENHQWVHDGLHGIVISCSNPSALASAINRLLDDPAGRTAMGRAGQTVIVERNDLRTHMMRMETIYQHVASMSV